MNKRERRFSEPSQRPPKRHERNRPLTPSRPQLDEDNSIMLPIVASRTSSEAPRFRTAVTLRDLDNVLANLPLASVANKETELLQWIFRPASHDQFLVTREVECVDSQSKRRYLPHVSINISEKIFRRTSQKWPDLVSNLRIFFVPTTDEKVSNVARFSCEDWFESKNVAQCESSIRLIKFFRFLMGGKIDAATGQRLLEALRMCEPQPLSLQQPAAFGKEPNRSSVAELKGRTTADLKQSRSSSVTPRFVVNHPPPINYTVMVARSELRNLLERLQIVNDQRKVAEDIICGRRELDVEQALLDFLQHLQRILASMRGEAAAECKPDELWTWSESEMAHGTMCTLTFKMDLTCMCWKLLALAETLADDESPLKDPTILSASHMSEGKEAITTVQVRSDWRSNHEEARHQAAARGLVAILNTIHKLVAALLLDVDLTPKRCLQVVVTAPQDPAVVNSNTIDTTRRIVQTLAGSMEFHPFVSAMWLIREYDRETTSILSTLSRINQLLESDERRPA